MLNYLKVDDRNRQLVMDRTFAKNVQNTNSEEYRHLQQVRKDYPTFAVVARQIKKNPNKECYKGLTYEYMTEYIMKYEPAETRKAVLVEFEDMIFISKCHSQAKRYPAIKNWFLDKYPEVKKFGITNEENKVTDLPATTQEFKKAS